MQSALHFCVVGEYLQGLVKYVFLSKVNKEEFQFFLNRQQFENNPTNEEKLVFRLKIRTFLAYVFNF